MDKDTLTKQKLQKRISAVKTADAINAIEGAPISDFACELSARWARGEITGQEMLTALRESHERIAEHSAEKAMAKEST